MSASDLLQMARLGRRDAATSLLREEFGRLQSPEQRVELCRWIALCFEGLEDYANAGEWYEMAGYLSLTQTSSEIANAIRALPEYERARTCYTACEDYERMDSCSSMIARLNTMFAAS